MEQSSKINRGEWSEEEQRLCREGIRRYGRQWDSISKLVATRSKQQVKARASWLKTRNGKDPFEEYGGSLSFDEESESSLESSSDEEEEEEESEEEESEEEEELSSDDEGTKRRGRGIPIPWSKEENRLFLVGLRFYGRGKWKDIGAVIKTKTNREVIRHAQKYLKQMDEGKDIFEGLLERKSDFAHLPQNKGAARVSLSPQATMSTGVVQINKGEWSEEEKCLFLEGIQKFGKQWDSVTKLVKTRSRLQIQSRASYLKGRAREGKDSFAELGISLSSDDEEKSDSEDDPSSSDEEEDGVSKRKGTWSPKEQQQLREALQQHGKDWEPISNIVKTRTIQQIKSQFNYFRSLPGGADLVPKRNDSKSSTPIRKRKSARKSVFAHVPSRKRPARVSLSPPKSDSKPKATEVVARTSLSPPSRRRRGIKSDSSSRDEEEHCQQGISKYGLGNWKDIASVVKTRDRNQVRSHALHAKNAKVASKGNRHNFDKEDEVDNMLFSYDEEEEGNDVTAASSTSRRRPATNNTSRGVSAVSAKKRPAVQGASTSNTSAKKQRRLPKVPPKKTITIIGATGGTGLCLVEQALAAGHNVKALVRNPNKFCFELSLNENLTVTKGDVTKYKDVKASLVGSTDVVVCLGGRGNQDSQICSTAQPVIDRALNEVDPNMRLVIVTSMAVGDSYHDVTWMTRRFADFVLASAINDKNLQERAVIRDTTNWVIVRPVGLNDGPKTETAQGGPHAAPAASKTIPRADVADFILKQCLSGKDEWKRNPVTVFPPQ